MKIIFFNALYLPIYLAHDKGADRKKTDEYHQVFIAGMMILALLTAEGVPYWKPDKSQSVFNYRPYSIRFKKEDNEQTLEAYQKMKQLKKVTIKDKTYEVRSMFTIIDGKAACVISGPSADKAIGSMVCPMCHRPPTQLNVSPQEVYDEVDWNDDNIEEKLTTLSIMHDGLGLMMLLIMITCKYLANVRKPQVKESQRPRVQKWYQKIKDQLFLQLKIYLDRVTAQCCGTRAREAKIFFDVENAEIIYEILMQVVPLAMIKNSCYMWEAARSTLNPLNPEKYLKIAVEWHADYIEKFSWHRMNPKSHKITSHPANFQKMINRIFGELAKISTGDTNEEVGEHTNYIFKKARAKHSVKSDAIKIMITAGDMMMLKTDPVMISLRVDPKTRKNRKIHSEKVLDILDLNEPENQDSEDNHEITVGSHRGIALNLRHVLADSQNQTELENSDSGSEIAESEDSESENSDLDYDTASEGEGYFEEMWALEDIEAE